jgi:hypothetical protein
VCESDIKSRQIIWLFNCCNSKIPILRENKKAPVKKASIRQLGLGLDSLAWTVFLSFRAKTSFLKRPYHKEDKHF